MRHRIARAALAVMAVSTLTLGAGTIAVASAPPLVEIDGAYGPVSIAYDRLVAINEAVSSAADQRVAMAALPVEEQMALHYANNPAAVGSIDGLPSPSTEENDDEENNDCQAHPQECAEGVKAPAPPESEIEKPPAGPPVNCETTTASVTAEGFFGNDLYTFIQDVYRCWDGLMVSMVDVNPDYDTHWLWWNCIHQQSPEIPINVVNPPLSEAPSYEVKSTGVCRYGVSLTVNDKGIECPCQYSFPSIFRQITADGGSKMLRYTV